MALRQLEVVEMIDWYDGVVQAVVSTSWARGKYLCSLIAFNADLKKRVFALLPLDEDELSEIRLRLNSDWDALLLYLKQLWSDANGSVVILCYEDMKEQVIAEAVIEASIVKNQAVSEIEQVAGESRMAWFGEF